MGRKKREQDNYWDSEEFEKDQAAVNKGDEEAPAPVEEEEETVSKQNAKNKKQQKQKQKGKKGKQQIVEEEEEPEPEPEEEPEPEPEPEPEVEVEETTTNESSKKKKKKKKPKKKGAAETHAVETEPEETVSEEVVVEEPVVATKTEEKTTNAKKNKKKGKGADNNAEEEDDKASAKSKKKKKGGIGNKLAQFILEQRAEEERRRLEEEARIKEEEEEEERLRLEEEEQAAIAEAKKIKKKLKEKKKQQDLAVKAEEKKRADALARLQGMQGVILPNLEDSKKRPVYGNKKKKKPQQKTDAVAASPSAEKSEPVAAVEAAPAPAEEEFIEVEEEIEEEIEEEVDDDEVSEVKEKEKAKATEDEDLDDWESADVDELLNKKEGDSWEAATEVKKPKKVVKKIVKKVVKKLVPKPKSTPTSSLALNNSNGSSSSPSTAAHAESSVQSKQEEAAKEELKEDMRSPICCVLGHVDAGKTKILDKIRSTNVQGGEAGGITQQIGATYLPIEVIRTQTEQLNKAGKLSYKVPGLLIIDTPGHESFTNLRSRGSSLCDIAILVVDFHSLLQPQTRESLTLLKQRKTPFVVALNKVDRLYDWKSTPNSPIQLSLKKQKKDTIVEYEQHIKDAIVQFANEGLNATLYYKNTDFKTVVSIVPCSAKTGEGIPDLLMLLVQLTQKMMSKQLLLLSELKCTILEVKVVDGFGTTVDVILSNGELRQGDTILVCGRNGAIVTTIRSLLTPQPCSEMRVTKSGYIHHKSVKAAQGIKIVASDLEFAVAGTSLLVAKPGDDMHRLQEEVQEDLKKFTQMVDKTGKGVYVQASTLGSLEALLAFLKDSKVPVAAVNIGPVHLKDVKRAGVMLEHDKQYAVMLCFDVKVDPEADELADELGVKIFTADIIYHLTDQFQKYLDTLKAEKQKAAAEEAVFPTIIRILKEHVYNTRDPIIVGVEVVEGLLRVGTPLVASIDGGKKLDLGKCASIEYNKKNVDKAGKGMEVCIKIDPSNLSQKPLLGRQFEIEDPIYSKLTRNSLNALKDNFAEELTKNNKELLQVAVKLKKIFAID